MGDVGAGGVGVYGFSGDEPVPEPSRYGVGVYARAGAGAGLALFVEGKALFSRSKRISIGASKTSVKVTLSGVTTSSYILATLQTSISGCYVRAVVPASGSFTIYLSKAPARRLHRLPGLNQEPDDGCTVPRHARSREGIPSEDGSPPPLACCGRRRRRARSRQGPSHLRPRDPAARARGAAAPLAHKRSRGAATR